MFNCNVSMFYLFSFEVFVPCFFKYKNEHICKYMYMYMYMYVLNFQVQMEIEHLTVYIMHLILHDQSESH